ncbi:MAG: 50S ribosomal protein L29 [Dehalococcoidales bacterium]|nr:50S ribosomal protein L29 [Dehalococcoidales bacterium]
MKAEEIRALKPGELQKKLEEAHKELFDIRFRISTRQLVNHNEMRRVKKDIARMKTVLREKELEIR